MVIACPQCGYDLKSPVKDGVAACGNCKRVFDTSPYNRILSACWYIRRHNIADLKLLVHHGIIEEEALIALALAYDGDYTHDETVKILKRLGVSEKYAYEEV